jgi:PAS domain S-box-containing protein
VGAVVVNFRDITGQKRFELILRENEERAQRELAELEHIYQTAPVGLCLIGADLRYLRINERLAAMNGLPAGEHLGRTVAEVIPEAAPYFVPLLRRIMESGRPVLDWQFRTEKSAAGGPRDLLASYYPVKAGSGMIVGVAGVVQEITELKRVESRTARMDSCCLAPMANCSTPAPRFWDTRARSSAPARCSTCSTRTSAQGFPRRLPHSSRGRARCSPANIACGTKTVRGAGSRRSARTCWATE